MFKKVYEHTVVIHSHSIVHCLLFFTKYELYECTNVRIKYCLLFKKVFSFEFLVYCFIVIIASLLHCSKNVYPVGYLFLFSLRCSMGLSYGVNCSTFIVHYLLHTVYYILHRSLFTADCRLPTVDCLLFYCISIYFYLFLFFISMFSFIVLCNNTLYFLILI